MHSARLGLEGMAINQPRCGSDGVSSGCSLVLCHDYVLCFFQKIGKALPLVPICCCWLPIEIKLLEGRKSRAGTMRKSLTESGSSEEPLMLKSRTRDGRKKLE